MDQVKSFLTKFKSTRKANPVHDGDIEFDDQAAEDLDGRDDDQHDDDDLNEDERTGIKYMDQLVRVSYYFISSATCDLNLVLPSCASNSNVLRIETKNV